ncbi:MAG: NmrA family NAD(P)-binding protein [Elusimicrobia bacterium]|nr:NmrA family NAD(P)-binding protein [Elusimicrobiota bacterium]
MIVVTAATGQIGHALVEELLKQGQKVRALARDAKKLAPLAQKARKPASWTSRTGRRSRRPFGARPRSFVDPPALQRAGLSRLLQPSQPRLCRRRARRRGQKSGQPLEPGRPPARRHRTHQGPLRPRKRLDALESVDRLHLRPGYFMENAFFGLGLIKAQGINGSPIAPNIKIPMIATRDIAQRAARALAAGDFRGREVMELHGPRDLSLAEVTRALGAAIGKPDLPYVQFPYPDAFNAMVNMGLSPDVAALFNEMYKAFNEGTLKPTQPRSVETTTPTSIEEFAKSFAAVYNTH